MYVDCTGICGISENPDLPVSYFSNWIPVKPDFVDPPHDDFEGPTTRLFGAIARYGDESSSELGSCSKSFGANALFHSFAILVPVPSWSVGRRFQSVNCASYLLNSESYNYGVQFSRFEVRTRSRTMTPALKFFGGRRRATTALGTTWMLSGRREWTRTGAPSGDVHPAIPAIKAQEID